MKKIIILFLAFNLNAFSQTPNWKLIDEYEDFKLFKRTHSEKAAWYKFEYKSLKIVQSILGDEQKIKMVLVLHEFDCKNKMIGILAEIKYDDEENVIKSIDNGKFSILENVIPDSLGEKILNDFCKK